MIEYGGGLMSRGIIDSIPDADNLLMAIAKNDYESVVLIDSSDGSVVDIYHGCDILADTDLTDFSNITYDNGIKNYLMELCADLNVYDVYERMTLSQVVKELKRAASYHVYYLRYDTEGNRMRKKVSFYRTDESEDWICCTVRDVTDDFLKLEAQKKQIEEALLIAKSANQSKSEFLTHVSREIRTPLSSIMESVRLAQSEQDNGDTLDECFHDIKTCVDYVNELIDDILEIRLMDEKRLELKEDVLEVRELLHRIDRIVRPRMDSKRIKFTYETVNLSRPRLIGDRKRLSQIIMKLLDNAIKNTRVGGEIKLVVHEEIKRKNYGFLEITVRDNGVGMSKEKITELFSPLPNESVNNTRRGGIGLSLVKNFVDAMGGTIIAESKESVGSNFVVSLELPVAEDLIRQRSETSVVGSYDFTGKTILLAEDHPLNISIANRLLENVGITVLTAVNGQEAVEKYNMHYKDIDLILMDIRMPIMDGIEATRLIRTSGRENAKDIPILAMTSDAFEEDIRRSSETGMNDHLAKPINPSQLYKAIDRFAIKR